MRAPQAQRRDGVGSGQAVPGLSCVCAAGWLWPVHVRARDSCMRGGVNPRPEASGGRGRDGLTHVWSVSMYEHQGASGEASVMRVTSRVREPRHVGVTRAPPGAAEYTRGEPSRVGW